MISSIFQAAKQMNIKVKLEKRLEVERSRRGEQNRGTARLKWKIKQEQQNKYERLTMNLINKE